MLSLPIVLLCKLMFLFEIEGIGGCFIVGFLEFFLWVLIILYSGRNFFGACFL